MFRFFFLLFFFFFKQKTAYEMRISDWSSDVCSSDLFSTAKRAELSEQDDVPRETVLTTRRGSDIGSAMTIRAVFDVLVIVGGHAGSEAPAATARAGARVGLITKDETGRANVRTPVHNAQIVCPTLLD